MTQAIITLSSASYEASHPQNPNPVSHLNLVAPVSPQTAKCYLLMAKNTFIDELLYVPSYGWKDKDGALIIPTSKQLWSGLFPG
jgi:hypothetical protein